MPSIAHRNARTVQVGAAKFGRWEPRRRSIRLTAAEKDRLSSHIVADRRTGCWLWNGRAEKYGEICFRGVPMKAHRLMMQLFLDEALPADAQVHHECERPGCVNPAHLKLVTRAQHTERHRSGVGRRT